MNLEYESVEYNNAASLRIIDTNLLCFAHQMLAHLLLSPRVAAGEIYCLFQQFVLHGLRQWKKFLSSYCLLCKASNCSISGITQPSLDLLTWPVFPTEKVNGGHRNPCYVVCTFSKGWSRADYRGEKQSHLFLYNNKPLFSSGKSRAGISILMAQTCFANLPMLSLWKMIGFSRDGQPLSFLTSNREWIKGIFPNWLVTAHHLTQITVTFWLTSRALVMCLTFSTAAFCSSMIFLQNRFLFLSEARDCSHKWNFSWGTVL